MEIRSRQSRSLTHEKLLSGKTAPLYPKEASLSTFPIIPELYKVGHTIVYPIRRGSKMWMQKASVTQVVQHDRTQPPLLACLNPTGRKVTIQNLDNCVVVGD